MKKIFPYLLLILILMPMSEIQAKRTAPASADSISYEGITYSTPTNMMGFVEARSEKNNQVLWTTEVYSIKYNPNLETDVQDVFIKKLEIVNDTLLITNEKEQKYTVDLKIGKVNSAIGKGTGRHPRLLIATVVLGLAVLYKYLVK